MSVITWPNPRSSPSRSRSAISATSAQYCEPSWRTRQPAPPKRPSTAATFSSSSGQAPVDGFLPVEAGEVSTDYFVRIVTRDRSGPIMPTGHSALRIQQDNRMVAGLFSELPEWLFTFCRSMELPSRGSSGILAINPVFHRFPLEAMGVLGPAARSDDMRASFHRATASRRHGQCVFRRHRAVRLNGKAARAGSEAREEQFLLGGIPHPRCIGVP
jgi:hypothetical protein